MNLRLRFQVLVRDGHTCQYCGAQPPDVVLEVDHVIPRSAGGLDVLSNLVTACRECNQGKKADVLEPLDESLEPVEWPEWPESTHTAAISAVLAGLDEVSYFWSEWAGEEPSIEVCHRLALLAIEHGFGLVRRAMRISAVRHGYVSSERNSAAHQETRPATTGRIDAREVQRTLERWDNEQRWQTGD